MNSRERHGEDGAGPAAYAAFAQRRHASLVADVRPTHAIAAVIDLHGRFLERQIVALGQDPHLSISNMAAVIQQFRALYSGKTFQGVGIGLPGRVAPESNRLVFAPNLHWPSFGIRERLHELLGLAVQLENAANASLLSELWFGRMDGYGMPCW